MVSKKSGVSEDFKNRAGNKLKLPKREFPAGIGRVGMSVKLLIILKIDMCNKILVPCKCAHAPNDILKYA